MSKRFKVDIHNHILPERWPDLKEVIQALSLIVVLLRATRLACRGTDTEGGFNFTIIAKAKPG